MRESFDVRVSDVFGMVPLWLSEHAAAGRVSRDAVALYAFMAGKYAARGSGKCWVTHATVAREFGVNERSVRRWLDQLREVGAVTWESGHPGRANTYVLWLRPCGETCGKACGSSRSVANGNGLQSPIRTPESVASDSGVRRARTPESDQPEESITIGDDAALRAQAQAASPPADIREGVEMLRAALRRGGDPEVPAGLAATPVAAPAEGDGDRPREERQQPTRRRGVRCPAAEADPAPGIRLTSTSLAD